MPSTQETFGVTNDLIGSYIERTNVDGEFIKALELNKQIVVYGASKQGKTSLILKHLKKENIISVECSPAMSLIDIYKSVLRQLKVELEDVKTKEVEINGKMQVSLNAKIKIPLVGEVDVGTTPEAGGASKNTIQYKTVEYNLALAQDISEILTEFNFDKKIILENFHYLLDDIQKEFAFDLRTFQDLDIHFIILGIWRERNRLTQFNGDLQDRIVEVAVEPWTKEDFEKVLKKGSDILNVDFKEVQNKMVTACFDSIGVFQELAKECCLDSGIINTGKTVIKITEANLEKAIARKLDDYAGRHKRNLETFANSPRKPTEQTIPLYIPYYFIRVLLTTDIGKITTGFTRKYIHESIIAIHHRATDVRPSDMSNFLHPIINYQIKRNINPPIFDYDQSINTLRVIDSTLYFFLRYCDRKEILEEIPLPAEELKFT